MSLVEQIDGHQYLYLHEIAEPDVGVLRVVIEEAKASSDTEDIDVGGAKITDAHPIISDESCYEYEVIFGDYIAYSVLNESYTFAPESEEYVGRLFRIYSKSHFLDYVRAATFASEEFPGKFTHYELVCLDHVLDVVCVSEPVLSILRRI